MWFLEPYGWFMRVSGASWGLLGASWGFLGDLGAVSSCHGAVLGRGWRRLGALLGPLGAILRSSWVLLGASSRPLGILLRLLGALLEPHGTCLTKRSAISKMCENLHTYCIFWLPMGSKMRPRCTQDDQVEPKWLQGDGRMGQDIR